MLASTLPYCESDCDGLDGFDDSDIHVNMSDVLLDGSPGSGDGDESGLDSNLDTLGDYEFFGLEDVAHLKYSGSKVSTSESLQVHPAFLPRFGHSNRYRCVPWSAENRFRTTAKRVHTLRRR